jgi:hypothetical protein
MALWNLLDGGLSRSGPLLRPFESMRGGTLGTNPRQVGFFFIGIHMFATLSIHKCNN